jgi:hypothetical protein
MTSTRYRNKSVALLLWSTLQDKVLHCKSAEDTGVARQGHATTQLHVLREANMNSKPGCSVNCSKLRSRRSIKFLQTQNINTKIVHELQDVGETPTQGGDIERSNCECRTSRAGSRLYPARHWDEEAEA